MIQAKSNKKGQAAIEYLVTYSWAFLVILGAVGTLMYFDAFNPSKWIPDDCDFGEQLNCIDFFVGTDEVTDESILVLKFRNNFEQEILIKEITGEGLDDYTPLIPPSIVNGGIGKFNLTIDRNIYVGDKETFNINITFSRNAVGAPEHYIMGKVSSKVADNSLGLV